MSDVYNIEVHGHHVYRITDDGILVHNNLIGCNAANEATGQLAVQISGPGQHVAGQIDTIAQMRPFADRLKDLIGNPSQ